VGDENNCLNTDLIALGKILVYSSLVGSRLGLENVVLLIDILTMKSFSLKLIVLSFKNVGSINGL
jgi:hypothetical protein